MTPLYASVLGWIYVVLHQHSSYISIEFIVKDSLRPPIRHVIKRYECVTLSEKPFRVLFLWTSANCGKKILYFVEKIKVIDKILSFTKNVLMHTNTDVCIWIWSSAFYGSPYHVKQHPAHCNDFYIPSLLLVHVPISISREEVWSRCVSRSLITEKSNLLKSFLEISSDGGTILNIPTLFNA